MTSRPSRGARLAAFAQAFGASRGQRFLLRTSGQPVPHLGLMADTPAWLQRDREQDQAMLSAMMALLHFRPQMDRELSGLRLGLIAAELGEALYDVACGVDCPPAPLCASPALVLPRPDQMREIGATLMQRAIPVALAGRYAGAQGDADMASLADLAVALCTSQGLWTENEDA